MKCHFCLLVFVNFKPLLSHMWFPPCPTAHQVSGYPCGGPLLLPQEYCHDFPTCRDAQHPFWCCWLLNCNYHHRFPLVTVAAADNSGSWWIPGRPCISICYIIWSLSSSHCTLKSKWESKRVFALIQMLHKNNTSVISLTLTLFTLFGIEEGEHRTILILRWKAHIWFTKQHWQFTKNS